LFHLTVAIARFFEFLLLDIAKSIVGLAAFGLAVLVACVACVLGLQKLARRIARHHK
jgi:hypothetical protein